MEYHTCRLIPYPLFLGYLLFYIEDPNHKRGRLILGILIPFGGTCYFMGAIMKQKSILLLPSHFRTQVREAPNRRGKTVATLKCGEFVFAHTQNFDGWLKLSGQPAAGSSLGTLWSCLGKLP